MHDCADINAIEFGIRKLILIDFNYRYALIIIFRFFIAEQNHVISLLAEKPILH